MVERDEVNVDWAVLIGRAETECPELGRKLSGARGLLYEAQDMLNAAWRHMPEISCISNADMDSKNVLWADDEPLVIDLECLDYGQPVWDMFQLALSWSGGVLCNMDYDRLQAFIAGYREEGGVIDVDLAKLYGAGFSWLEWLEYNVGRAMGDGGIDKEEREMGLKEAVEALGRIEYYDSIKEELIAALGGRQ